MENSLEKITNYLNYITSIRNNVDSEISHEFLVEDYNNFLNQINSIREVLKKESL